MNEQPELIILQSILKIIPLFGNDDLSFVVFPEVLPVQKQGLDQFCIGQTDFSHIQPLEDSRGFFGCFIPNELHIVKQCPRKISENSLIFLIFVEPVRNRLKGLLHKMEVNGVLKAQRFGGCDIGEEIFALISGLILKPV